MNYSFSLKHAQNYGVDEAIMLHNFIFWISQNLANNRHQHDGRTWTYNSQKSFLILFPFWSRRQVGRILNSLIKQNILVTGNYNKIAFDKTTWYAFNDEALFLDDYKPSPPHITQPLNQTVQPKKQNRPTEETKPSNRRNKTVQPIPDIKTQIQNTDNKNNNKVDDSLKKCFLPEEQSSAKKILQPLADEQQLEVLAVLLSMVNKNKVKNKGSYLRAIVKSVQNNTFTPLPKQTKPKPKKSVEMPKIDNLTYFKQQYEKFGQDALNAMPELFRKQVLA